MASTLLIAGYFVFFNMDVCLAEEVLEFFSQILNIKSSSTIAGEA